ncbi:cell envelope integrity protein TolA [Spiroplasma endosymbiont of Tipula paludosa]|uniref:cell envelope integrity protein TolA n=1 Tax=Spiroplasma endosymbiont of Tipula paludosa TaxID=3066295 RepID=UPI0035C89F88
MVSTNSQINAIEKINQFSNPSFDSKNEELTKKVLQYLHSRDSFKEMYSDYNIKGSSDYEYKKILKEVNDFLEASGLNEAIRKNVVRKDSTPHSNIESISGPLIPSNNEIKSLVKNYLVSKEVAVINKEIKEESLTTSYSNIKKYWKELKKWITDYYLPPQIYLQFINESIYEPIACITQKAILNGNISNDEIKTLTKNIEDLSLDIAKTIVNEFVSDNGEAINKLKKSMNIDIHFSNNSTVDTNPYFDSKTLYNRSTKLNFLYDHLLRNIYITTGHCLEKSKYLDLLNFSSKTIKQVKNCRFSLLQFSKPSPIACLGDGEWRKTRIDYPISKDLECLDLQRLNKSNWKHTQHGCFLSRNITENDKFICRNTSELLAVNIKLKDKLSIIAKENTSQFNIKLPLSDSHIKEDTASLLEQSTDSYIDEDTVSMSYSTYNPQTDSYIDEDTVSMSYSTYNPQTDSYIDEDTVSMSYSTYNPQTDSYIDEDTVSMSYSTYNPQTDSYIDEDTVSMSYSTYNPQTDSYIDEDTVSMSYSTYNPQTDSYIDEDTVSMSYSTYNPQTDKVLQGKENRAKFYQEFQEEGKLIASSKENFQTKNDSFNVNQEEENKDIKYLQELEEIFIQQKNKKEDEQSLINSRLEKRQEQIAESQISNCVNLQQNLAEQTAKIAQSKNQKLREEEKLKQEQEIRRQLNNQARLKKLQEENKQKAITKRKTRQLEPA